MAAEEPKVTKLKPGEGAGDFKPKQGRKGGRGTPGGEKRTQNPCILSPSGTVDPQCKKVYQRSVAGRQTLQQFLSEKAGQGMTEKDMFMAAVDGLMNRRLGYVGAYLDSKNPGRTYTRNQAMRIADAVMTKMDIGENPGARLTGPSGGGRQRGKAPEAGKAGASVRQQRKAPGGRGGGFGMPETWAKPGEENAARPVEKPEKRKPRAQPVSKTDVQRTLEDIKAGRLSKEDLQKMLQERREGGGGRGPAAPIPGSAADEKRQASIETGKKREEREQAKPPAREEKPQPAEAPAPAPESEVSVPETEGLRVSDEDITSLFRSKYNQYRDAAYNREVQRARSRGDVMPKKSGVQLSDDDISDAAQETIDELSETFDVDRDAAIAAINKKYRLNIASAPEAAPPAEETPPPGAEPAPEPGEEAAPAPEEEAPADEQSLTVSDDQITNLFRNKYNEYKQAALQQATYDARKFKRIAPKMSDIQLSDEEIADAAQDAIDELSEEFRIDRDRAIAAINRKFGLSIGAGAETPESEAVMPVQPEPEAPAPAPPSRRAKPQGFGGKFTPRQIEEVKDSLKQAGSAQEAVEQYRQGTLFPAGLVTETSATNPLEGGGSVPEQAAPGSAQTPTAPPGQGSLLDEEGNPRDFTKSGPAPEATASRRPEVARQIPLNLGRENTAEKLKQRAGIEQRRLAKQEKALGKPPKPPRRRGKAPVQQEMFTPSGNPRRFAGSPPASSGTMRQAPDTRKGSIGMLPPREQRNNPPQGEVSPAVENPPSQSPTQRRPGLDAFARQILNVANKANQSREAHNAARDRLPENIRRIIPRFSEEEQMSYEEFAGTIRSMMR
jgi:hypothetical protein